MSRKDVQDEYVKMANDYKELNECLKELESLPPEKQQVAADNIKTIREHIEKVKENYMRWGYIIWLLNKPVNKKKAQRYEEREKVKLEDTISTHEEENETALNKLKEYL